MLTGKEHIFKDDDQAIAITSIVKKNGKIYCGLTGGPICLVEFDIQKKIFTDKINIFPWANDTPQIVLRKIHNAIGISQDHKIVVGEGILYTWDGIPFDLRKEHNTPAMEERRKQCGVPTLNMDKISPHHMPSFDMRSLVGGKIITYDPTNKKTQAIAQLPMGEYIQSMVVDTKNNKAYGHSIGGCHFFEVDLNSGTLTDHGRISTWAFHNLTVKNGIAYGAWIDFDLENKLRVLRFDPQKGFLERLEAVYLDDPGPRVQGNRGIDQWLIHSSGDIYVGTAGTGVLYRFDEAKLTLEKIGRIGEGGRITSLDEDEHGRVLFTGGFPKMSVGRYDPKTQTMEDFGPITDKYQKIYFHGSVYENHTLYLAETDSGVASLWEVPISE